MPDFLLKGSDKEFCPCFEPQALSNIIENNDKPGEFPLWIQDRSCFRFQYSVYPVRHDKGRGNIFFVPFELCADFTQSVADDIFTDDTKNGSTDTQMCFPLTFDSCILDDI